MTKKLVSKTGWVFRGANGVEAIVFTDGDDRDGDTLWFNVRALPKPKVTLGAQMWLDDGEMIRLPFKSQASILPDRTGVLVWFESGEYVNPDGTEVFPKPNNAAIYNADGSLRFQLRLPQGDYPTGRIGGIHSGSVPSDDAIRSFLTRYGIPLDNMPESFDDMLGVVVATHHDSYPEWVYLVDPSSPELIPTGQWVRW